VRIRQYAYFAIYSDRLTPSDITGSLGVEPDAFRVRGSKSTEPPVPRHHSWRIDSRLPGLTVEAHLQVIVDRLNPYAEAIGTLVGERLGRVHTGGVTLLLRHENGAYHLAVSPPETAESHEAIVGTPTEVLEVLSRWGCHSTTITDALYEADPSWAVTHDAEVLRRRGQAPESE
jgi:hypothetical protein